MEPRLRSRRILQPHARPQRIAVHPHLAHHIERTRPVAKPVPHPHAPVCRLLARFEQFARCAPLLQRIAGYPHPQAAEEQPAFAAKESHRSVQQSARAWPQPHLATVGCSQQAGVRRHGGNSGTLGALPATTVGSAHRASPTPSRASNRSRILDPAYRARSTVSGSKLPACCLRCKRVVKGPPAKGAAFTSNEPAPAAANSSRRGVTAGRANGYSTAATSTASRLEGSLRPERHADSFPVPGEHAVKNDAPGIEHFTSGRPGFGAGVGDLHAFAPHRHAPQSERAALRNRNRPPLRREFWPRQVRDAGLHHHHRMGHQLLSPPLEFSVDVDGIVRVVGSRGKGKCEILTQPAPRPDAERRRIRGRHLPSVDGGHAQGAHQFLVARVLQTHGNHEGHAGAGQVGVTAGSICAHGGRLHLNGQGSRRITGRIISEGCGANQQWQNCSHDALHGADGSNSLVQAQCGPIFRQEQPAEVAGHRDRRRDPKWHGIPMLIEEPSKERHHERHHQAP